MDRPEDVEANPLTDAVYVILTNNSRRKAGQEDAANPRAGNKFGHIIEMIAPDGDHAAEQFTWNMLVRCGDPSGRRRRRNLQSGDIAERLVRHAGQLRGRPYGPVVDRHRRQFCGGDRTRRRHVGPGDRRSAARAAAKLFFRCPAGAEMCGPEFTPDDTTLFVAVQHPGEVDDDAAPPGTFENPSTRWPDFHPNMPPRPAVLAITRAGRRQDWRLSIFF